MLDGLAVANFLQRPAAPGFADAGDEDRYYRSHDRGNRRVLPLVRLVAIAGFLALVVDVVPR